MAVSDTLAITWTVNLWLWKLVLSVKNH
jgi:hypothetical protein